MIQMFLHSKIDEAGRMLFENNPLSVVCSLVCDQDKQCEGHCVLGRKGQPVHISSIENYVSESYLDRLELSCEAKKGKRVAIIGSGPAGITISVLLAQKGYDVTLFESRDKIGGVLRYGIPEFRLPKTILDRYKVQLTRLGIKIRPNTVIGTTLTLDDLQRDGYKAVFIGTGIWRPRKRLQRLYRGLAVFLRQPARFWLSLCPGDPLQNRQLFLQRRWCACRSLQPDPEG